MFVCVCCVCKGLNADGDWHPAPEGLRHGEGVWLQATKARRTYIP